MNSISNQPNKKSSYKSHIVPSVVTAALALSAAIPLTAALASNAGSASADVAPVSLTRTADACSVPSAVAGVSHTGNVLGASTAVHHSMTGSSVTGNGNGNSGNGNGNGTGASNGSGNGNGSGSNANGNTQSNTGGLLGGVNAIVPVSVLNGSLDNVLSGNTVSVPVLSNNNGNTTNVPVLNNVLNVVNDLL